MSGLTIIASLAISADGFVAGIDAVVRGCTTVDRGRDFGAWAPGREHVLRP